MNIKTQISRISNLVQRLIHKLQSLKLLNMNNHNFEEAVEACNNININNQDLSIGYKILGSATPQTITPTNDNVGYSIVNVTIDNNIINSNNIIYGRSILGIDGNAKNSNENHRLYYTVKTTKNLYKEKEIRIKDNYFINRYNQSRPVFIWREAGNLPKNTSVVLQCNISLLNYNTDIIHFYNLWNQDVIVYYLNGLYIKQNNDNLIYTSATPNECISYFEIKTPNLLLPPYSYADKSLIFEINYPGLYFAGVYNILFINKKIE